MSDNRSKTKSLATKAWVRALEMTATIERNPRNTLPVLMSNLASRFEEAPALIDENERMSFRALDDRINQYARWALTQGLSPGDVVALMMHNCSQYLAVWLGLTRVGVIVALINVNLVQESLAHAINSVAPVHLIVGADLANRVSEVMHRIAPSIRSWVHGGEFKGLRPLIPELDRESCETLLNADDRTPRLQDCALYIYTSGTTGLPKPARISHFRLMIWSYWFSGLMNVSASDRMFNCLPMYHSVGGAVAIGALLVQGASVVIRRKFSARSFWADIVASECTLFQYIGELCRYLVNIPRDPHESSHRLRLCCGNGLRADVWEPFKSRYRIPQIIEFYASTEGNLSLYNCDEKPGAIGRIPPFLIHRSNLALVKFDHESGQPVRDQNGFCMRCAPGESGEAIGKIADDSANLIGRFDGYVDREASAKKTLENVFAPGDRWFRSGDLMRQDNSGYFYFVDRVGDTFRWKGENVSTTEVATKIGAFPGVAEAAVYGVTIPGTEGRAGMAAIVPAAEFDLSGFGQFLAESLPDYAQPLFLRLSERLGTTETFKTKNQQLAREGYDPTIVSDRLYFCDRHGQGWIPLDTELYRRLLDGEMRL